MLIIERDTCHGGEQGYNDYDDGALVGHHGEVNMSLVMMMMISSVMRAPSLVSLVSKRWLEAIESQARPNIFRSGGCERILLYLWDVLMKKKHTSFGHCPHPLGAGWVRPESFGHMTWRINS